MNYSILAIALPASFGMCASAAIIGTNSPALPVTEHRIETLPHAQQSTWRRYLERSARQQHADQIFLRRELERQGLKETLIPPPGHAAGGEFNRPADWYASDEAGRIADIVLSYQTPGGGWSKNLDMTRHPRLPGEHFNPDNRSHHLGEGDNDTPADAGWNYVGTFDNNATTTQLRFLARIITARPGRAMAGYRDAFDRGLAYIFNAQYPNGGWPQVWPLEGGYHDAITFNDGAMVHVLEFLRELGERKDEFAFVSRRNAARARASVQRGVDCTLAAQIVVHDRRSVWCQQHDALTLAPTSARNYEMPCQSSSESAGIVMFLMSLSDPSREVVVAVHAAADWFERVQIRDHAFTVVGEQGRKLITSPGAEPIWSRYYDLATDRPIFGDRDKSIHDDVNEISFERRQGYSWFGSSPRAALDRYAVWRRNHPAAQ